MHLYPLILKKPIYHIESVWGNSHNTSAHKTNSMLVTNPHVTSTKCLHTYVHNTLWRHIHDYRGACVHPVDYHSPLWGNKLDLKGPRSVKHSWTNQASTGKLQNHNAHCKIYATHSSHHITYT